MCFKGGLRIKPKTKLTTDLSPLSIWLLRILFALVSIAIVLNISSRYYWSFIGMFHILLGALFLTIKPYKKKWMNHANGLFLFTLGALMITKDSAGEKFTFIMGAVIVTLVMASALLYFIFTCATKCKNQ